jgi:hypothetical protein
MHQTDVFYLYSYESLESGDSRMKKFYVIRSKKEMDVKEKIIKAFSLDEACKIVKEQYAETLLEGETFYIFPFFHELRYDENNRVVWPAKGEMASISRLE